MRARGDRLYRVFTIFLVDKEALADIANVYNYQAFVETDKAGYIIRQWLASNLYDRIRFASSLSLAVQLITFLLI